MLPEQVRGKYIPPKMNTNSLIMTDTHCKRDANAYSDNDQKSTSVYLSDVFVMRG